MVEALYKYYYFYYSMFQIQLLLNKNIITQFNHQGIVYLKTIKHSIGLDR